MKKLFGLITICSVLAMPVLAAKPVNISDRINQPVPATNIELVKKVFSEDIEVIRGKGKPASPPGLDKNKEEDTATGVLGDTATGNKYAVVIGICDYPGGDNDICWSDGDSVNMYKALTTLYGYDPANVYLFRDTNPDNLNITDGAATYENILEAVNTIRDQEVAGDEIVFFFSGHGGRTDDTSGDEADGKDEVLIVHDGNDIVGILDDTLQMWFSDFDTSRIVFVFDTCLAGGQNDVAGEGRIIAMATGENQSAYVYSKGDPETGELGEGVFSHYFVNEGMLQGLADVYNHDDDTILGEPNDVVIEEAFDYAKDNIPPYLKRRQKPVISDNFTNDLLL